MATMAPKPSNLVKLLHFGAMSSFSLKWLESYAYDTKKNQDKGWVDSNLTIWNQDTMKQIPNFDYLSILKNNELFLKCLKSITI